MRESIRKQINKAVEKLYPDIEVDFSVDWAPESTGADLATNVAMVLAKKLGKKPMDIAEEIKGYLSPANYGGSLPSQGESYKVEAILPGFINFTLPRETWTGALQEILQQEGKYGTSKIGKGKKARIEYVSANPTGPIHIGNARGGPYGEMICKVLEATGWKVLREYLHNDVGGQVEKLGKTIWYWYQKINGVDSQFPEDGYKGEYPEEIAKTALQKLGKDLGENNISELTAFAMDYIFEENLKTMKELGIEFDVVIKESELQSSGKVTKAVDELKKKGLAKENEGALWFAPNDEFLQDHDAVIIKSDGKPTYFASDIAYHKEKFTSGYDLVMDVLGSNHHGHVPKLQALCKVFKFAPENFHILLYQYVRVKKGNEVVKMAKRAGTFVTAKEVLELVGKDSMIFFLLSTAVNTHMDFDLELARDTSERNPVYKIQYAHARINSILKKSEIRSTKSETKLKIINSKEELELIRELGKFPELVEEISKTYNVHRLPHYLLGLAERFHGFYERVKVITEDNDLTSARLSLVKGVMIVLSNGLKLMGITPAEKM